MRVSLFNKIVKLNSINSSNINKNSLNKIVKLNSINNNRYYNSSSGGINTRYYNCYSNSLNNKNILQTLNKMAKLNILNNLNKFNSLIKLVNPLKALKSLRLNLLTKLLLILGFSFTLSHAVIDDFKTATWNMQGSSASSEAKWSVSIRQMFSGASGIDILAVQEAGTLPQTARATGRTFDFNGTSVQVSEHIWNLGTSQRPSFVYIYYAPTDAGANRVNLALVSRMPADEVFLLPPPTTASRPMLGIRINNDAFFSIHALANGGVDASAIVHNIDIFFQSSPTLASTNWIIMGDFNREPGELLSSFELALRLRTRIITNSAITQVSARRTLDYAIVGNSNRAIVPAPLPSITASTFFGGFRTHLASDHFPVTFRRFQ
jgi:cytolethal distending toxin subunit B